jgi:anti-anti-sigma factor
MITDCRTDECTVVQVSGELDIATAPALCDHLLALIRNGHPIVLELTGVEFMDSSGLEVLLRCHRSAERSGTGLVLRRPSHRVVRLLELSGLTSHFKMETDVSDEETRVSVPRPR